MLRQEKGDKPVKLWGFLCGVEIAEGGPTTEYICNKLADSIQYVEGVGRIDVECLGEVETEEEPKALLP